MPIYPLLNDIEKMDVLHESFIVLNTEVDLDRTHVVINGNPYVLSRAGSEEILM